ncbi:hypothetical protein [uncultured Croceicoccus sp.]|uniref:hypothetical protein n=1 Tax=uncultured Croceicoccus sp. TaxID=1295329 RepID=UPI002618E1B3|nr:hypothetical protein [uncultured Croceicoccus sp.]
MGDNVTVGGNDVDVIGTSNDETITIVSGNVTLDASFANGGDTIELAGEAEEYTAALSGSRVIITNVATGATVSIPVGTAGLDVEFGNDDTRSLMVMNGAVMFGDQTVTSTAVTLEAGSETEDSLTTALNNLQEAQDALDTFLASDDADVDNDPDTLTDETALDVNLKEARTQLQYDIEGRDSDGNLDPDNAAGSDAQLRANLTDAQDAVTAAEAAIADVDGLAAAIDDLEASQQAYIAARTEAGQDYAALVGEVASYNALTTNDVALAMNSAGVPITIDDMANFEGGETVVAYSDGTAAIRVNTAGTGLEVVGTAPNTAAFTALLADARAVFQSVVDMESAENTFQGDIVSVEALDGQDLAQPVETYYNAETGALTQAFFDNASLTEALFDAEDAVEAANQEIEDRADLKEAVTEAQALVTQYDDLAGDVTDAQDAIVELGYELPVAIEDTADLTATARSDVYILSGDNLDGAASINLFDAAGDDILFVGSGFTLSNISATTDLDASNQGDVNVLEVFVQQSGDDTILYFEDEAFAGNSSNGFQGFTLTLEGVDASTVSYDATGYITIEEMPVA